MHEDPWSSLSSPDHAGAVSARRVDADDPWDFYWATDKERRCLLVLRHDLGLVKTQRLPRLRGVEVFTDAQPGEKCSLVLRLTDGALRDIFYRLCLDIIASAEGATTEQEAVATAIARTWRWHHLLRGGSSRTLSPEEQKGLIGELLVLERYFIACFSAASAMDAWRGPLDAPMDFLHRGIAVESKARGTASAASVRISSEYQLDEATVEKLFLHLCVLDPVDGDNADGFTVTDVASRVRLNLKDEDTFILDHYDALLAAAGFNFEDDYSMTRWMGNERGIYEVRASFPRLNTHSIPAGISGLRYSLSLSECGEFLITPALLEAALRGGEYGG
jgi:hypothetical protein